MTNTHTQMLCMNDGDALEVTNEAYSGFRNPAQWLSDWATGGRHNETGVAVNGYTALTNAAVWQAVNIIAGDIGQIPFKLMRDDYNEQRQHPCSQLLNIRPNELQTPSLFKETLMQWALMFGNFVGWVIREGPTPVEIIPLRPDCLWHEVFAFERQKAVIYHYYSPYNGQTYDFLPDDVVHVQGLTSDGLWGYPLYQVGANTIGYSMALQRHGSRQFKNGARPSGVLKTAGKFNPQARQNLREEWYAAQGGENEGRIAVLYDGLEFQQMAMSNVDAQWIEAEEKSVIAIARLFNLPPYRLNCIDTSSNRANLEEQNENYKQTTLTRWTNRIAEEFCRKLLRVAEFISGRWRLIPQFDQTLGPDIDTRSQIGANMVTTTIWNPNEARHFLGYPPRPGGEEYGNPMTTPGEPAAESAESADAPETPANEVENAHRSLLFDRIEHVIEVEHSRLRHAAESSENFTNWLDHFYKGSESRFLDMASKIAAASLKACESAGFSVPNWQSALNKYAKVRHETFFDLISTVTQSDLPKAIDRVISTTNGELSARLFESATGGKSWASKS